MIRDECRKPAHVLASSRLVFGNPNGSRAHDFDFRKVSACFLSPLPDKAKTPFDQMRIGELKNDAVADAAGAAQRFWSVARNPNRRHSVVGPIHLNRMTFISDLLPAVKIANDPDGFFEVFQCRRLLAHHAPGAVAASDPAVHTAA